MRDAEMNDLFSVPVARCKLDIDVKEMAKECLNYSLNNPSISKSNMGGYQSGDISNLNWFQEFSNQLKEEVTRFENHTKCPKTKGLYSWLNINGKKDIILACNGSGGAGFNFCCKYIVNAISKGHAPIIKNEGGTKLIIPKRLKIVVGSGADKSLTHP